MLSLIDEKNKILALKTSSVSGAPYIGGGGLNEDGTAITAAGAVPGVVIGGQGVVDPLAEVRRCVR